MKYKSIFISDVHLGTRACQAERLLEFLENNKTENLFLVGDIIDGWRMRQKFYWPSKHNDIFRKILKFAKKGNVVYITGNHDEFLRPLVEGESLLFGNITIVDEYEYEAVRGQKLLLTHGDFYDIVTRYHKWLAILGDIAYTFLLWINVILAKVRARLGMGYWSISKYLKYKVKDAVSFISDFEDSLATECKRKGYVGVICGHIHHPTIKIREDGIIYMNCGDWVESCSALVETLDGKFKIVNL